MKDILTRLAEGPVLGDGGYLLELEKRGYVQAGPFTPEVTLNHPEALVELHREFLIAGAEVLQALTFYASEEKLATVGLAGRTEEINRQAVRIARSVASEGNALVAGNLSLTCMYDPEDPASSDRVRVHWPVRRTRWPSLRRARGTDAGHGCHRSRPRAACRPEWP